MSEDSDRKPMIIDTSGLATENLDVEESIKGFREDIRNHITDAFEKIPDQKSGKRTSLEEYVRSSPESTIFVKKQDLHLFPVVIDEAKKFASSHHGPSKWLTFVREHEEEHLAEGWRVDADITGIGLVMFKKNGRVSFGGFVGANAEKLSSGERLRVWLAPSIPGDADVLESLKLLSQSKTIEELFSNLNEINIIMLEKFSVKPLKFIRRVMKE